VGLCEISGIHVVKHNFLRSRVKIVILYIFCIFFSNLGTWQQARGKFHLFYKRVFNDKTNPGWRKQAVKTEGRPLQIPAQSTGGYGGQLTTTCGVAWILAVNLFHRSFPSTKVPISNSLCNCLVTKPWGGRRMPWAAKWSLTVSGAWIDEQPPVPFTFSSLQLVDEFIPVSCSTAREENDSCHRKQDGHRQLKAETRGDWQARLTMQHIKLLGIAVPNIISATRPCVSRIGSYWCINITDLESASVFSAVGMLPNWQVQGAISKIVITCQESYPEFTINVGVLMLLISSAGKKHWEQVKVVNEPGSIPRTA